MTQAAVIAKLSALIPNWKQAMEDKINISREAIKWRVSAGTIMEGQTFDALVQIVDKRIEDLQALGEELFNTPAPNRLERRRKLTKGELRNILRSFRSDWDFSLGWPSGSIEFLETLGYRSQGDAWYSPDP